jgi:hypothetical protein
MLHCRHHCTTTPVPLHKDVAVHDLFSNSGATSSTSTAAPRIVAKRGFTHKSEFLQFDLLLEVLKILTTLFIFICT